MGNTSSSEAPRRAPRRLSKPRTLGHASAAHLSSPSDLSTPDSPRHRDGYLAGSRQLASFQHQPCSSPTRDEPAGSGSSSARPGRRPSQRQSETARSIVSRPLLLEPRPMVARRSTDVARASSVVQHCGGAIRPLTRARSLHSMRARSDTPSSGFPQANQSAATETMVETSHSAHVSSRSSSQLGEAAFQGNIRVSSYIPIRRRSLIQTPGIATRAVRDCPRSPTLPSIRIRHSTPAAQDDGISSICTDRHLSLPSYALVSQERAATPCEADYRQLGGIKFGTLHITNGSPIRSPAVDGGSWTAQHTTRLASSPRPGCFVTSEPAWPLKGYTDISNDQVQPDVSVQSAPPKFHDLSQASPSVIGASTSGRTILPDTGNAWLSEPSKEYIVTTRRSPLSSGPLSTSVRQPGPQRSDPDLDKGVDVVEYISPEVLDVRDDPNAKPREGGNKSQLFGKSLRSSMVRSDSGFISTSTSSSKSSRKTLSKADSGYSSNFSLRSFGTSSTKSRGETDQTTFPLEPAASNMEEKRLPSMQNGHARHVRGTQSMSSPGTFTLKSRDKFRRFSTRTGKDHAGPLESGNDRSKHLRTMSADANTSMLRGTSKEDDLRMPNNSLGKQGKLRRSSGDANKQSLITAYGSLHDITGTIPAVPTQLKARLDDHSGNFRTAPKRVALGAEPGQQTPKTIANLRQQTLITIAESRQQTLKIIAESRQQTLKMNAESRQQTLKPIAEPGQQTLKTRLSLESLDLAGTEGKTKLPYKNYGREFEPEQASPYQELVHQPSPLPAVPDYQTDTAQLSSNAAPRTSIKRKPVGSGPRNPPRNVRDNEVVSEKTVSEVVAYAGHNKKETDATHQDLTIVDDTDVSAKPRVRRTLVKQNRKSQVTVSKTPDVDSRASAPDLVSSFTMPPCPPLPQHDLQSQGPKNSRQQLPSQSLPIVTKTVPSLSQKSSRESLHSYQWNPSQGEMPDPAPVSAAPQTRQSQGDPGRNPPLVYRQFHLRDRGGTPREYLDDNGQQYRVLHSYNSPAYKNVPIWS